MRLYRRRQEAGWQLLGALGEPEEIVEQVGVPIAGGLSFLEYIATIAPAGLILLAPLNETTGTTADDKSAQDNNGTYRAATMLNQTSFLTGEGAPKWTPASADYISLPASFLADFNPDEYCVNLWFKVRAASVWSDSAVRELIELNRDTNNRALIFKNSTANQIIFRHLMASTLTQVTLTISDTGWNMLTQKASKSGDSLKAFLNGIQTGTTQTGLGTAAGAITSAVLGSLNLIGGNPYDGYEAYVAIWSGAGNLPSDAQIAGLYDFLV